MKKVALIPNDKRDIGFSLTKTLLEFTLSRGCKVMIDIEYRDKIGDFYGVEYVSYPELMVCADFGFVLGGDGSILRDSRDAAISGLPLLGINLGHLGYIAELEISELDLLERVIAGDYITEERMMLDVILIRDEKCIQSLSPSLNDAVISNGPVPSLLSLDLYCNGRIAGSYRLDGIINATPTGSTAYSMSAGGSIVDPTLDCLCVTPISSHSLNARPVIFSGNCVLEFRNMSCRHNDIYLTADGRDTVKIFDGDSVRINRSKYRTKLIRLKSRDFLTVLHNKMV